MIIRYSKKTLLYVIIFIGLLITGTTLRTGFYSNVFLQRYSPLLYIGLILLIFSKSKENDLFKRKFSISNVLASIFIIIIAVFEVILNETLISKLSLLISLIIPIVIIAYQFTSKDEFKRFFNIFYKFLRFSCCIIVIVGLLDVIFNYSITLSIANYTSIGSYFRILKQHRIVSYMGHPLFTSEILLSFYIFSHYYSLINSSKEKLYPFIISAIGILLCQSRTATILLLVAFLTFNFNVKKIRYLVLAIIIGLIAYYFGLFDAVLERFTLFNRGDIRNTSLNSLIASGKLNFYLFHGQNMNFITDATSMAAALEYPILRWAYSFGIIISGLLVIYVFIIPLVKIYRDKNYVLLISTLLLILDVNTYSGLGDIGMKQIFLYIILCTLINLSKYLRMEKKDEII